MKDAQEVYMSYLKAEKTAGRGDRLTLRDLSRAEAEYKKRLLDFSCRAPPAMVPLVKFLTGVVN